MIKFIVRRLLFGMLVLLGTSVLIFIIARVVPGDVATIALGSRATDAAKEALREELYLNDHLPIQYVKWLGDVLQGDFGNSFITKRAVVQDVKQFFPATLELIMVSGVFIIIGTFTLGILAGKHKNSPIDGLVRMMSYIGIALPAFVVGILLLLLFGYKFKVIPVLGRLNSMAPPAHITGLYMWMAYLSAILRLLGTLLHIFTACLCFSFRAVGTGRPVLRSSLVDNSNREYMVVSTSYGLPSD